MGRAWVPEAKEVQDTTICLHSEGLIFWNAKDVIIFDFFTQEKYNNWIVLCKLARPAENHHP